MKSTNYIFLHLLLLFGGLAHSQIVEYYSNPQRYYFSNYYLHDTIVAGHVECWECYNPETAVLTRTYAPNSRITIYGVAIPIQCFELLSQYQYQNPFGTVGWNNMMRFYDTSDCSVFAATKSTMPDYDMDIVARSDIKRGCHVVEGTFFQMPETDTLFYQPNNIHWLRHGVIEVYFPQPVIVSDTFFIGTNIPPLQMWNREHTALGNGVGGVLTRPAVDPQLHCGYTKIIHGDYLVWTESYEDVYHASVPCDNTWGGPFPIIAPPPCVGPLQLTVKEQHKQGATIEWDAQYANTLFELEYGPMGFTEGTGTTIGNIYPDAQHHCSQTISSLPMGTDMTVRVRAYCQMTGGFSEWQSVDFHTHQYYTVNTSVNNDYWGYVKGGGDYIADTTIKLYAYRKGENCNFSNWSDGSTQNPRVVTVTQDTSFRAIFRCDSVGIAQATSVDSQLAIYPNPASGEVTLQSPEAIGSWAIMDMLGRTALSGDTRESAVTVDIKDLNPGIYIVSIKNIYSPIKPLPQTA